MAGTEKNDSLKRRDKNEDSITIRVYYLDSSRSQKLDSSIVDYTTRFPLQGTDVFLGNNGSPSRSILFDPFRKPGWDPGFHAYDRYKWTLENVRFFNTTRPYSELNYQLASRSEQLIEVVHTQNRTPNWNFHIGYRLINAPGFFKNQKSNHNNYVLTSWYQTIDKRYNAYLVLLGNKLQAGENGGIQDTADFMNDPIFKDRFNIYTKLGGDSRYGTNFFSTDVGTGNRYSDFTAMLRHQYDLGKKDSLVTDSTVVPLFYPRLRFEHTIKYSSQRYQFFDPAADSIYYNDYYDSTFSADIDTFQLQDRWKELMNDFSIYTFPDAKNLHQYFKTGASVQNLALKNRSVSPNFFNIFGHAEYRNRTRNQKWDMLAKGKLYFAGLNAGDYAVEAKLHRAVGNKNGYVELGFENINRTPGFIYDGRSDFYLKKTSEDFKKENILHFSADLYQPFLQLRLSGNYYVVTNYTYLDGYYDLQQEGALFNILGVSAQKTINLGKNWKWHADVYVQQKIGNAPVNLPLIFTRNRIGYEGSLGFKNLSIAFGAEARYHTPYYADGYSPLLGKFQLQDSIKIENKLPDVAAYVHFRIKGFKLYTRAENLNTARYQNNSFGFTGNNFAAPGYPYPGLIIRVGIFWSFVN